MFFGTHYIQAQNHALKAFTALTKPDIIILHQLYDHARALPFGMLYAAITKDYATLSPNIYVDSLARLLQSHCVQRESIGKYRMYSITTTGIQLLASFNAKLDALVKEKIDRHGNGFISR